MLSSNYSIWKPQIITKRRCPAGRQKVGNRGPSMVREAEVDILWPTYTLQERPLLYLMEQPEVQGKGKCEEVQGQSKESESKYTL
ncbi:integrin alpha-PS2 [Trichonephila inaurata madagascariensis]|uniref:Integrin alpha-PS2 n=1 Tax=Trichonephila inaurata madagascariensis TaxID=2747483 RepID=A0A8X6WQN5_9ARAC|nr:integrin alpha-PS2 [Trichonephila inaurata madagascariensis]